MDLGTPELLIILVIVVLIFGPGRIVKVSREIGTSIRQFRQGLEETSQPDQEEKE